MKTMSKDNKKANVNEQTDVQNEKTVNQGEVETEEENKSEFEIDRENMSDEQYISALEQKLGQAIAEANTCKALTQRLQADFVWNVPMQ